MRILNFQKINTDQKAIGKLIRREALVELKGAGSRSALTRKVFGRDLNPEQAVERIVEDVKKKGDTALFKYCRAFDGFSANSRNIKVTPAEIKAALKAISPSLMKALRIAIKNVKAFHLKEKPKIGSITAKRPWWAKGGFPWTGWGFMCRVAWPPILPRSS